MEEDEQFWSTEYLVMEHQVEEHLTCAAVGGPACLALLDICSGTGTGTWTSSSKDLGL